MRMEQAEFFAKFTRLISIALDYSQNKYFSYADLAFFIVLHHLLLRCINLSKRSDQSTGDRVVMSSPRRFIRARRTYGRVAHQDGRQSVVAARRIVTANDEQAISDVIIAATAAKGAPTGSRAYRQHTGRRKHQRQRRELVGTEPPPSGRLGSIST